MPGGGPAGNGTTAQAAAAPDVFGAAGGGQPPGGGQQSDARPGSRRSLKNWRVRSRLLLLVVIPVFTASAFGGIFIASSAQSAIVDSRVLTLANLSGKITGLAQALENEREDTVTFIALGSTDGGRGAAANAPTPPAPELALLSQDYAITTGWAQQVEALAKGVDGSYSTLAQQDTQAAVTAIGNLPAIRAAATGSKLPALIVVGEYATVINTLQAVEGQIGVGSSDSTLAGEVRVLSLLSSMKEETSQQQALLTSALSPDLVSLEQEQFGAATQQAVTDAQAQEQGDQNEFDTAATADQRQLFNSVLAGSNIVLAQAQEQQAISLASSKSPIATDPTISDASSSLTYVVGGLRSVEQQFANQVIARSGSLHNGAITAAVLFSLAVMLLLGIALTATVIVGRSMVRPLRRLRNGALDVAEARLPEMVRQMSQTDGAGVPLQVEPIDVDSSDEIGQVARAFDQVHREAVRLAANEAALRGNINAMFVNLSRRSQSLVERQIRVISQLERSEQDSKRLANLFQVDHLATRMRRNSENLLVLAGQELSRRWSRPVALVDVLRAAGSEIEQYERVTLEVQPGISVRREAVSDVVHLTSELVENATSFSTDEAPVTMSAHMLSSGGVLVEITDQGMGIGQEELAHLNWRLDHPPVVDVAVSRRMGLFVVARLAARHGIRVRLRPGQVGGLTALVWLPDTTITLAETGQGPLGPVPAAAETRVRGNGGTGAFAATTTRVRTSPGLAGGTSLARPAPSREVRNTAAARLADQMRAPVRDKAPEVSWTPDPADSGPVVPPVQKDGLAANDYERLPIFDQVESDWFSRGKQAIARFGEGGGNGGKGWSSPADAGFRAAELVYAPASDGTTMAGLPKRTPKANLVPGAAPAAEPVSETAAGSPQARTAAEIGERLGSFQRGIREGRAAAAGGSFDGGEGPAS